VEVVAVTEVQVPMRAYISTFVCITAVRVRAARALVGTCRHGQRTLDGEPRVAVGEGLVVGGVRVRVSARLVSITAVRARAARALVGTCRPGQRPLDGEPRVAVGKGLVVGGVRVGVGARLVTSQPF